MPVETPKPIVFPIDPLERAGGSDFEYRRRTVQGILESYHSNYDVLSEAVQNSIDAVEDAKLASLPAPYLIEVTINFTENWVGVLDTGIGMTGEQVTSVFAPHVSFKQQSWAGNKRDKKNMYRGYKGVGLTFLAYGTDEIIIHSKRNDSFIKAKMRYGRSWAEGKRPDPAVLVEDTDSSPLDSQPRGTYVRVQFSPSTRPRSLVKVAASEPVWATILRTKTAIGQVLLGRGPLCDIKVKLQIIDGGQKKTTDIEPEFLYPHEVKRSPPFRFLDLVKYWETHAEQSAPPPDKLRQDGIYLTWDSDRIRKELTKEQQEEYSEELQRYTPYLYAFVPYQGSVWGELNQISTGVKNRNYLYPAS